MCMRFSPLGIEGPVRKSKASEWGKETEMTERPPAACRMSPAFQFGNCFLKNFQEKVAEYRKNWMPLKFMGSSDWIVFVVK